MPTLLGRAICCHTTGIPRFRLRMPDRLMECSELQSESTKQNPALLGRDVRLKTPRGRFRSSTAVAAGSCNEAHEWAQERITRPTAWAHMYAHPAVKRQDMVGRSCQNTDRTSRMFGPEHQQSTATLTSDFSTTTNPIEMIQKPMCSKLSLVSYEPSSLMNIFKS